MMTRGPRQHTHASALVQALLLGAAALLLQPHGTNRPGAVQATAAWLASSTPQPYLASKLLQPLAWVMLVACAVPHAAGTPSGTVPLGLGSKEEVKGLERQANVMREQLASLLAAQEQQQQQQLGGATASTGAAAGGSGLPAERVLQVLQLRLDLAVALQQLNHLKPDGGKRVGEAEQHYRAALALLDAVERSSASSGQPITFGGGGAPLRVQAAGNLGALLLEAERPAEALVLLDAVLAEQQQGQQWQRQAGGQALLCGLCFNRAKALSSLGRLQEAQQAYERAAGGAHGLDAQCYAKSLAAMEALPDGLLDQMLGAVRQAQDAGLHQPGAGGGGDPAAAAAAAAAAGWLGALGARELSWLEFAAFKALDARGRHVEAWGHMDRANTLMAPLYGYDPEHDLRQLSIITGLFKQPLLASLAERERGAGRELRQQAGRVAGPVTPIFIVGLPRSGSTLLETMLGAHPAGVWGGGEDTAMAPLTGEVNALLGSGGARPGDLRAFGRRYLDEMIQRAYASGWPADRPLQYIVDKMLRNLWLVGYIELLLPGACIINVQRHPLDVAMSCYSQPFGYHGVPWAWHLDHIAQQIKMASQLVQHWAEHLPGRVLTLRYEEVVASPEASMRRVLAHCGLPWDQGVLDFHTANRTVSTASVAQVRQPLYRGSVGRWQRYAAQLAPLAAALDEEVRRYERELAAQLAMDELAQLPAMALSLPALGGVGGAKDEL